MAAEVLGGIGMTDEFDIGFFIERAAVHAGAGRPYLAGGSGSDTGGKGLPSKCPASEGMGIA